MSHDHDHDHQHGSPKQGGCGCCNGHCGLWGMVFIALGLVAGAMLQWWPAEPSVWRWLPLMAVYVIGGKQMFVESWETFWQRHQLSIDFLMSAAAVGAALMGDPLDGAVLIFLFSLSHTLEEYAMGRTRQAINRLMDLSPSMATLADEQGHEAKQVPVESLEPGQKVLVRPGQRIAADGVVHSGGSDVDQSAITGESMPVHKAVGDKVYAGTVAQGGSLVVEVTHRAGQTMLAKIIQLVEQAREQRAPAQYFIDRFAHPYTLAVLGATVLTALVLPWCFGVAWMDALYRAVTLLVVASPCALVISTPAAILSGMANGARYGILFKGGAYLDLAGTIDTIAFDKTGTLTVGQPQLLSVVSQQDILKPSSQAGEGELPADDKLLASPHAARVLALAASVERTAEHHLAQAAVEAAQRQSLDIPQSDDFKAIVGQGVTGRVQGQTIWVGNRVLARSMQASPSQALLDWADGQAVLARTVVYVGADNQTLGALAFGDQLKPNADTIVRHLKREGIRRIVVLSGDHPDTVQAVVAKLGADEVLAGLLPDQKVEVIRTLAKSSSGVAMVGDGVNDAPAMATATLGIAMGAAGTDVAIETADVVLVSDEIQKVDYVIHLGKRTRRVVRQNIFFSVGWMMLLIVITLTVGMPLALAVVAHEGSTLLVAVNGLRLLMSKPHPPTV